MLKLVICCIINAQHIAFLVQDLHMSIHFVFHLQVFKLRVFGFSKFYSKSSHHQHCKDHLTNTKTVLVRHSKTADTVVESAQHGLCHH